MIPKSDLAARRKTIAERFSSVDALVVSALPNIRYLAGFTGSNALLVLVKDGASTLFTDPRYTIQASDESDCKVVVAKGPLMTAVSKLISRKRWKKVAFEETRISFVQYEHLKDAVAAKTDLVPMADVAGEDRMVKSAAEIELIRRSVQTNSRAFEKALTRVRPAMTENDMAAEIEYQMRRFGAEGVAFESIVAAGPRSALPHARPTGERLGANRLLLFDVGALRDGYCSDMTRVVHLGPQSAKAKKLYKAVLQAQLAAVDAVRAGVKAGAVDRAARNVLKAHGLEQAFVHSTGHGLGLEIHEPPRLGRKDETRLQAGMVITIEPGAYVEGFGGVRIEDTVVVTEKGCEVLTPTSKELLSV